MSCTVTGQANGIMRYEITDQNNSDSVTFVPDESYSVKRGASKFAVFLPIEGENCKGGSGSKSGFNYELEQDKELDLKWEVIGDTKNTIDWMKQAALYAAAHGTKVTIEVTKDTNGKITLTKMTIPAK